MGGQGKEKPLMRKIGRLPGCLVVCTLALIGGVTLQQVSAETVLRVAMTAGDVPIVIGQPDQGFEGYRFVGYTCMTPSFCGIYPAPMWSLIYGQG